MPGFIKTGCCGFAAAQAQYARLFPVIEVQQTFYQPPRLATLERWRESFPAEFEFTIKAWQLITHEAWSKTYQRLKMNLSEAERQECGYFKDSQMVQAAWETTRQCAEVLQARLVLFQCPAGFKPTEVNLARMRSFFKTINRENLRLLWEPRGDWPDDLVSELCQELELIHAVDPFVRPTLSPRLTYFRLHGGEGYRHNFEEKELQTLLDLIPADVDAYVMFNNINMLEDAQTFQKMAGEDKLKSPAVKPGN